MDIRILNYFLIAAREENITKAAHLLHLTQPTLSRQLRQLEEELGTKLFLRGKHNIKLTEEGMLFRRRAQELVNLAEKAKEEVRQTNDELKGEIAIGCNESQSMNELADIITNFRKSYPFIKFALRSGNNEDIKEWLNNGLVDFGILIEPTEISHYSYIRMQNQDQWGILAHQEDPLSQKTNIHVQDLIGKPLITIMDESIHNALSIWSGSFADQMKPIMHYNLLTNAATLVNKQEGIAICPKPNCEFKEINFIPFKPEFRLGSLLVWKSKQIFSKASETFKKYLMELS